MQTRSSSSSLPIVADVHMHTSHSHGVASTAAMYAAAKAKGLSIIGFSEHSPRPEGYCYATDYQENLRATFATYIAEVQALKATAAQEGITVLLGLEVDYIAGQEDYARALCTEYPYDYIIGGLHFQGTWGFDGPEKEWEGISQAQRFTAYARYYQDLERMCRTGLFHVAAHPDLIKIHTVADFHHWLATPQAPALIDAALLAMKETGMAMEVSSAGLRKNCQEVYPCPAIIQRAAALGLPISFGADAHCENTPAFAFAELAHYAQQFGYAHSLIFSQGTPQVLPFSAGHAMLCTKPQGHGA
ncbi:histidinol-phosphatase [Desulfovibrio cuneatus]|uniref:histidinol-phosphatase n=1 Tax=Desulfovibrio cuneatus TaxID=159728 RepID=UPI0004155D43|nr:histidinol-phosphatase [Desulfovibrio cuneatus]